MEKIFNWGTTVSKEELVGKINELADIILDNTTKDNKLFTEIDKASFYTKNFPDLFTLTVVNREGKKYNPENEEDLVHEIHIKDLNLETFDEVNSKCGFGFPLEHKPNDISNRVVNAFIISKIIIEIVNDCSAKFKFFQPKESDLYNACYALAELITYLEIMSISAEYQFSTLINSIDGDTDTDVRIFYTLAHRLGIPLHTGYNYTFLVQLFNSYYKVQIDESGYAYSDEKVHNNVIHFELADEYSAPSDKYFMLGDKKISLTLDISTNGEDSTYHFNNFLKEDLDYLKDNGCLQCFKFTNDVRELYRNVGGYNISSRHIGKGEYNGRSDIIRIENNVKSKSEVYDIYRSLLKSEVPGYICQTIINGLLPYTIFKFKSGPTQIMILPMLEVEFRDMIEDTPINLKEI